MPIRYSNPKDEKPDNERVASGSTSDVKKLVNWITGPITRSNEGKGRRGTFFGGFIGMFAERSCHEKLWEMIAPGEKKTLYWKWFPKLAKTLRNLFLIRHHEWRAVVIVAAQAITSGTLDSSDTRHIVESFVAFLQRLEGLAVHLSFSETNWRTVARQRYSIDRRRRYGVVIADLHADRNTDPKCMLSSAKVPVLNDQEKRRLTENLDGEVYTMTMHQGNLAFILLAIYEAGSDTNTREDQCPADTRVYGVKFPPPATTVADGYADCGDHVDHIVPKMMKWFNKYREHTTDTAKEWLAVNVKHNTTNFEFWKHRLGNLAILPASDNMLLKDKHADSVLKKDKYMVAPCNRTKAVWRTKAVLQHDEEINVVVSQLENTTWSPKDCQELHTLTVDVLRKRWALPPRVPAATATRAPGGAVSAGPTVAEVAAAPTPEHVPVAMANGLAGPAMMPVVPVQPIFKTWTVREMKTNRASVTVKMKTPDDLHPINGNADCTSGKCTCKYVSPFAFVFTFNAVGLLNVFAHGYHLPLAANSCQSPYVSSLLSLQVRHDILRWCALHAVSHKADCK